MMRFPRSRNTCAMTFALALSAAANASTSGIVISQVYGGNGVAYNGDYVELFNAGSSPVTMANWSIQYSSATGTGLFNANGVTAINATLQPGQYYLVKLGPVTTGGTALSPDFTGSTTTNLSATAGKVILANVSTGLACNGSSTVCNATQTAQIVDLVGYGSANYFEGVGAAPAPSSTLAALRANNGCTDANINSADFVVGTPAPRNSSSPVNVCGPLTEQPILPSCPSSVNTAQGTNVPVALSATDSDSIVNGATLTSVVPAAAGISLGSLTPASVDGGTGTVNLNIGSGVAVGSYTATVQFANNEAQTANCSIAITVKAAAGSVTPIYTIQGSGALSPYDGQTVTTRGVVTKLNSNGFFLQDPVGDGNDSTSDGIFVYTASAPTVQVGQAIELTGLVDEYDMSAGASPQSAAHPITELKTISNIIVTGQGSITPKVITLPEAFDGELERYEGMLVTINTPLTASQNYFQGWYGQVTLSAGGRLFKPTMKYRPADAAAEQDLNIRRSILLDDGSSVENPNPIPYIGAGNTLRAGDTIPSVTGVIDYGLASNNSDGIADWKIHPTQAVTFTRANPRPTSAPAVGGNIKVASFNVLNYFNGNGSGGGYPTARGATNAAEFSRQRVKIIAAIQALNADVIGLEEIENDGTGSLSAIQDLVSGVNAVMGAGTYAVAPEPATGSGADEIKVAIIYKPGTLNLLAGTTLSDTNAIHDRPPVAQGFSLKSNGEKFSVIMNHFKSKRCASATGLDTDQGDGQGCYNNRRKQQASRLLTFIETVKAAAGDQDVLVMGDLNSYAKEDPVVVMTDGGLVNQLTRFDTSPYSFVFDGEAGSLDQALTTASLSAQVSNVATWHINADEPSVIDYNTDSYKTQDLYAPDMYRSSDHDPIVVGLTLAPLSTQTITFGTLADKVLGSAAFSVSATASSGLPVVFSSYTTAVCTVSGSTVTLVANGTCTIAANQAGGSGYSPAVEVTRSFAVKSSQTISFGSLPGLPLNSAPFALSATASSGLSVSYSTTTPTVCALSGNTVTLLAAGTCTIAANQAGDSQYGAATQVLQSFTVSAATGGTGGGDGDVPLPAWALLMLGASLFGAIRKKRS